MNDIIKISSNEITALQNQQNQVSTIVNSFQHIRQQQILKELSIGAKSRSKMLKRFSRWLSIIENKLFDPNVIDKIPLDKLMSLMKFVSTMNVKTLASMNNLDEVMVKYFDIISKTLQPQEDKPSDEIIETTKAKKEIIDKIKEIWAKNASIPEDITPNESR